MGSAARRAVTRAFALAALVLLSLAGPERAAATLAYGEVYLNVDAFALLGFGGRGDVVDDPDDLFVPHDSPVELRALVEPIGWDRFMTSQSTLPDGFASASMSGQGIGNVGVSAIRVDPGSAGANALFQQTVVNLANVPSARQDIEIEVPEIVLLTSTTLGNADLPARGIWRAEASAILRTIVRDANDIVLDDREALRLTATVDRTGTLTDLGSLQLALSPDLGVYGIGLGGLHAVEVPESAATGFRDILGYRFDPIVDTLLGPVIPAGGSLELQYRLAVRFEINSTDGDDELTGFDVRIGDPFGLSGENGAGFRLRDASAVPEPAALALLAGAALASRGARRRRGRTLLLALALALAPAAASHATVLLFDQERGTGTNPPVLPTSSGGTLPADYGDNVTGAVMAVPGGVFTYGDGGEGFTPDVTLDIFSAAATDTDPRVNLWQTGYGDLVNVIFADGPGTAGAPLLSIRFTAAPGFAVDLYGFDLAGFGVDYTIAGVSVLAGATTLFSETNVLVQGDMVGPRHTSFAFATPLSASELLLQVDVSNLASGIQDNVALDSVRFGQTPPRVVPEPGAALLAALALALAAVRRRSSAR
jgi:hypothetical protein